MGILILLAIGLVVSLAFSVIPRSAAAANRGYYSSYNEPDTDEDTGVITTASENPSPSVSSLSPKSANISGSSLTVNVTGSGFTSRSQARWNGLNRTTSFIDPSHLVMYLQSGDLYGANEKYVSVYNPGPGGGYSNGVRFEVVGASSGTSTSAYQAPSVSTSRSTSTVQNGEVMGASQENEPTSSQLVSNALYGSSYGLMPSGLTQWLIFAILVLLVVIVVRKLYLENKYHSTPLKHA